MMFLLDLAFAAEILALGVGLAFLVWACQNQGAGKRLAKFSGCLITILALTGMLCTSYYGLSYWFKGYFTEPRPCKIAMKNYGHKYNQSMPKVDLMQN